MASAIIVAIPKIDCPIFSDRKRKKFLFHSGVIKIEKMRVWGLFGIYERAPFAAPACNRAIHFMACCRAYASRIPMII